MKSLVTLIFVLSLASCNSSHSSKSQSCTFNNSPIDCTEMNTQAAGSETALRAQITSKIMILSDFLEIKDRDTNFSRETVNGRTHYCEVSTKDIFGFFFHFDEKSLFLRVKDLGESVKYEKVEGLTNSIYGQWKNSVEESDHTRITTLEILPDTLKITAECKFKD
jgi:hypothetical protein